MKKYFVSMGAFVAATLLFTGTALAAGQMQSGNMPMGMMNHKGMMMNQNVNWYGGPVYRGAPALKATAALVRAGGGAADFSFPKALVAMLGQKTVNAEVAKLDKQYGKKTVQIWLNGMTGAVDEGLRIATRDGVNLPAAPAKLTGTKLAAALVKAGTAPNGTFWAGHLFDVTLSHRIHNEVMMHINMTKGGNDDLIVHQVTNQAMYDVAHALGMKQVKLASLH